MIGLCLAVYGLWNFYVYSKRGINTSKNILLAQKMRLVILEVYSWKVFRFITWHFLFIIWKTASLIDSFESKIILRFSLVRLRKRNDAEIPIQAKSHLNYPQDQIPLLLFLTFRLGQHSQTQFKLKFILNSDLFYRASAMFLSLEPVSTVLCGTSCYDGDFLTMYSKYSRLLYVEIDLKSICLKTFFVSLM